jgi:hypothetical protein
MASPDQRKPVTIEQKERRGMIFPQLVLSEDVYLETGTDLDKSYQEITVKDGFNVDKNRLEKPMFYLKHTIPYSILKSLRSMEGFPSKTIIIPKIYFPDDLDETTFIQKEFKTGDIREFELSDRFDALNQTDYNFCLERLQKEETAGPFLAALMLADYHRIDSGNLKVLFNHKDDPGFLLDTIDPLTGNGSNLEDILLAKLDKAKFAIYLEKILDKLQKAEYRDQLLKNQLTLFQGANSAVITEAKGFITKKLDKGIKNFRDFVKKNKPFKVEERKDEVDERLEELDLNPDIVLRAKIITKSQEDDRFLNFILYTLIKKINNLRDLVKVENEADAIQELEERRIGDEHSFKLSIAGLLENSIAVLDQVRDDFSEKEIEKVDSIIEPVRRHFKDLKNSISTLNNLEAIDDFLLTCRALVKYFRITSDEDPEE